MRLRDQILSTAATNIACAALALVYSVVVARGLGPAHRGTFFVVQAYFGLGTLIFGLSVPTVVTVVLSRREFPLDAVHSAAVLLSAIMGLLGAPLMLALLLATAPLARASTGVLVLLFLTMPFALYKSMCAYIFLGLSRISLVNVFNLIDGALLVAVAVVAVSALHLGLRGLLAGLALESLGIAGVGFAMAARIERPRWRFSRQCLGELLRQGWKQHVAVATQQLYLKMDAVILGRFVPAAAVGEYAVARGLAERVSMVLEPVTRVMFPRIVSADAAASRWYAGTAFRVVAALGIGSALVLALVAPVLVPLLYGPAFRGAVAICLVLPFAFALLGAFIPLNLWFIGSLKRPVLNTVVNGIVLALVVVGGVALTSLKGGIGMAWATVGAFGVGLACAVLIANAKGLGLTRVVARWQDVTGLWRDAGAPAAAGRG